MKKTIISLILLLGIFNVAFSQDDNLITIEGTYQDYAGQSIEGGYIVIYPSLKYEQGYRDKHYKISVPPGSIIIFFYKELEYRVYINEPIKKYTSPPKLDVAPQNSAKIPVGSVAMNDTTKFDLYKYELYGIPENAEVIYQDGEYYWHSIDEVFFKKENNKFYVNTFYENIYFPKKLNVDYRSSFSLDFPNKLPKLQKQYQQGSDKLNDKLSLFSYGDAIDKNTTQTFNPYRLLRIGYNFKNSVKLTFKLKRKNQLVLNYNTENVIGIVPNSNKNVNNVNLYLKNFSFSKAENLKISLKTFYNHVKTHFAEHNANYSLLMHSITSTPPNFDNKNSHTAYSPPAQTPYRMVETDNFDKIQHFGSFLKLHYNSKKQWNLNYAASINQNRTNLQNIPSYIVATPWYTDKNTKETFFQTFAEFNYKYGSEPINYSLLLKSKFESSSFTRQLNKNSEIIESYPYNQRQLNEHLFYNNFVYRQNNFYLEATASGSLYNSNTLTGKKIYFLPSSNFSIRVSNFRFDAEYSKTIKEYPLNISNLYFNSLFYSSENFGYYQDINYPKVQTNIQPENIEKISFSANYHKYFSFNYIDLYASYDIYRYKNSIVPILVNKDFILQNAVNYTENNLKISFEYKPRRHYSFKLNFNKPTSRVTKILSGEERVPYAGFSDVSINFVKDKPIGAIVGSSFERDANGKVIVGTNGLPLVNNSLSIIGDPTPDWILNLDQYITVRNFKLSIHLEYKNGGDVWNGTKNALDYYGVSQSSADLRNSGTFIINGVTQTGAQNTTPVDVQTYLQYYGQSGIAENAIEDASWFRINEISLAYINDAKYYNDNLKFRIVVWVKNILVFTPYSGVDPQTALLGYQTNQALDYYNFPALQSFGVTFDVKF